MTPAAAPLDHVTITATDLASTVAFYDAVLGALGLVRVGELVDEEEDDAPVEAAGWGVPDAERAVLWVVGGSTATTGLHLSLLAPSRAAVEAFHAAGVLAGGSSYAAPRRWPIYRPGEFSGMIRDPAGNLLEAVSPE
jgi:catechol 2,3-dioxygenase-like lactoylglutathione lyase family enzyme